MLLSAFWFGLGIFLFFIRFVTKAPPHDAHEDSEDQKRGESRGQPNDHIGGSPHPVKADDSLALNNKYRTSLNILILTKRQINDINYI